ncbi:MAG: response regulator [Chloroflexi bacterium]|nr:response regulator [Chloroflexota bacterium]MBT4073409.1 response regulator [Chloroflexota bacterium]MBT4514751.1 response regulator [Chloroflexota bacterium]MBT5318592.1 response regulator [Chloroflexota bacterium]MBT6682463.1 response regulator [Chloroflexota bacterium]
MELILVVDDNPDVRLALTTLLVDEGYEVAEASDGDLGLQAARDRKPVLILLDLMMPRMDGFETLRELKKDENLADVPVVILTARRGSEDMTLARALGASDYLNKPWNDGGLEAAVKKALGKD